MKDSNVRPLFQKRIFWDVDFEHLDYDKKYKFIIERVFERGDVEDIRQCRRFYGDDLVKNVLLEAKYLSLSTMYLASAIFEKEISGFLCYKLMQSNPEHLLY